MGVMEERERQAQDTMEDTRRHEQARLAQEQKQAKSSTTEVDKALAGAGALAQGLQDDFRNGRDRTFDKAVRELVHPFSPSRSERRDQNREEEEQRRVALQEQQLRQNGPATGPSAQATQRNQQQENLIAARARDAKGQEIG